MFRLEFSRSCRVLDGREVHVVAVDPVLVRQHAAKGVGTQCRVIPGVRSHRFFQESKRPWEVRSPQGRLRLQVGRLCFPGGGGSGAERLDGQAVKLGLRCFGKLCLNLKHIFQFTPVYLRPDGLFRKAF